MTENEQVRLEPAEFQTYLHLGIIAANVGYGAMIFSIRREIASGVREHVPGDIMPWFAEHGFNDEDMAELYDFRNSLLHGVVLVEPDGAVQIVDPQKGGTQRTYTADEIKQYAIRFFNYRFENRVGLTGTTYLICECRAEFQQPDGWDEYQEHRDECSVYQQKMRELSDDAAKQE